MTLLIIGIILAALGAIGCMYGVWNIFNNYVYLVFTGGMGGAVTLLVVSFLMLVAGVVLLIIGIVQYNKAGQPPVHGHGIAADGHRPGGPSGSGHGDQPLPQLR